jgi:hypothetical protein
LGYLHHQLHPSGSSLSGLSLAEAKKQIQCPMFFSLCDLHLRNHLFAISAIIRVPEVENQGVNGVIPQVANRDVFLHINRKFLYLMATPSCYIKKNQEPLASYQKVCVHQELTFFVNAQGATLLSNAQGARCAQVTTKLKFVLKPSAKLFLLRACSICQVFETKIPEPISFFQVQFSFCFFNAVLLAAISPR